MGPWIWLKPGILINSWNKIGQLDSKRAHTRARGRIVESPLIGDFYVQKIGQIWGGRDDQRNLLK